jgi:hypothetical protein
MKVRFRLKSGAKIELEVLDLSPIGCMIDRRGWSAQPDERVLLQLEGLGFQPARVIWVEGDYAGIEFEQLLHETVLERLKQLLVAPA